jgi:hypothetical protein
VKTVYVLEPACFLTLRTVFPEGPKAIVGQELGGEYFQKTGPVIEKQVARAGFRLAAWLDGIAKEYEARQKAGDVSAEL